MFAAAYYGLLRIGEISESPHAVLARNVHIGTNKNKILFVLLTSKTHDLGSKPQLVKFGQKENDRPSRFDTPQLDPFIILNEYLAARPPALSDTEQFFVFSDNSAVKPEHLRTVLKEMIQKIKLNPNLYSFHGMRSGCTGDLLSYGVSVETIKKLGRWKSNAVFTYLRN